MLRLRQRSWLLWLREYIARSRKQSSDTRVALCGGSMSLRMQDRPASQQEESDQRSSARQLLSMLRLAITGSPSILRLCGAGMSQSLRLT
jgi:hypothetical protein